MTSELVNQQELYLWIWLPNKCAPIVAGKVAKVGGKYYFTYGKSYLNNPDAMSLSPIELPLQAGTFVPQGMHIIHSCLRDASPDAWGRRIIDSQFPHLNFNELDYLFHSGSNRIGAMDFQQSSEEYIIRSSEQLDLLGIDKFSDLLERDGPLIGDLEPIFYHGTSIGGARPKCLVDYKGKSTIAKFSLSTDYYPIIKLEYISMRLAKLLGLSVAEVDFMELLNREVLLVERFDRVYTEKGILKKSMLSALSLLNLSEMEARYASYQDLTDLIRQKFTNHEAVLKELFNRIAFNILIGNTDDHARNHSAFWNGQHFNLTPAYDLCPQKRVGYEATQAMGIEGAFGNKATLLNLLSTAEKFLLEEKDAKIMICSQISLLHEQWGRLCDEAQLANQDRKQVWGSTIYSDYCLQGWEA
jgi:serine/threonine-protein kinase HipA